MSGSALDRRVFLASAGLGLAAASSAVPAASAAAARAPVTPARPKLSFNIRDYGALGDGKTKDTLAIQQALDRCALLGGGEVVVPPGEYLTGSVAIGSNTTLRLDPAAILQGSPDLPDYPLVQVRWEGRLVRGYLGLISARDAQNIAIVGKGRILGNKTIRGRLQPTSNYRNPTLFEFVGCKTLDFRDCYTEQNGMWSIHTMFCENISFRDMTINGGADGIDIDSCKHVVIDNCDFTTADDCISLKSGRGMEGYTLARPTEDVRVTNCTFRDSFWACIGIGSESSGGIRGLVVERCKFLQARTFGIYIKTRVGRGAYIEDLTFRDIDVEGTRAGFLQITNLTSGLQDQYPVPGDDGIPRLRNFVFDNVRVKDMAVLVDATLLHPAKPLDGLTLSNISGTCTKGIALANIRRAVLRDIKVTGFTGPLVSINNVTGTGLAGAAALPAPPLPDPIPAPARPYVLGMLNPG